MMRTPISCSVSVSSNWSRNSSARLTDIFVNSWMFLSPTVTASTSGFSRRSAALRAGTEAHVLLDLLALLRRLRFAVAPLEIRDDPLERQHVRAPAAHAVAVADVDPLAVRAVEEQVLLLLRQVLPGLVEIELPLVCDPLDDGFVEARVARRPRDERALADRERRVGDEHVGVDFLLRAQTVATRAGPVRRVEREDARLELGQGDAVLGTCEPLRERELLAVDDVNHDEALGQGDSRLDRLREPRAQIGLHDEPVDDDFDRVLELLVEDDLVLEHLELAVDLHTREPVGAELLEDILVLAFAVADDRGVDRELRPFRKPQHLVDDRVDRLACDRPPADRAVRASDTRVQEAQVVVDLGDGADRRARVARGRLLVDRDRRREPVDRVDVGLLHHLQELARVGGERLHVTPLAFGVDRVERERRLARAGEPRDADQLVPRQRDGDVLEVVLAGTVDNQLVRGGHNRPSLASGIGRTSVRFGYDARRSTSRQTSFGSAMFPTASGPTTIVP